MLTLHGVVKVVGVKDNVRVASVLQVVNPPTERIQVVSKVVHRQVCLYLQCTKAWMTSDEPFRDR